MARPAGFEPTTPWFVAVVDNHLFVNIFPARPLLNVCSSVPNSVQKSRAKVAHGFWPCWPFGWEQSEFKVGSAGTRELFKYD